MIDTTKGAVEGGQNAINYGAGFSNDILGQSADKQLAQYSPYAAVGPSSLTSIQQLAGAGGPLDQTFSFNPTDLEKDPGYAFTLKQGQDAINRAAAARGDLFSGSTLKSLAGFTTGTANQYFNDAYNRANSTFQTNRSTALSRIGTLQGLAGMGLQAAGAGANAIGSTSAQTAQTLFGAGTQTANIGLQGADITGRALTGQGNAAAAGTIGQANAVSGAISGLGQSAGDAAITQFLLKRGVLGSSSGGGSLPGVIDYSMPQGASPGLPAGSY